MGNKCRTTWKRAPIFGVFSFVASFFGVFLLSWDFWTAGASQKDFFVSLFNFVFWVGPVLGIVFSIVAWLRSERYLGIPLIGLLIGVLIISFFSILAVYFYHIDQTPMPNPKEFSTHDPTIQSLPRRDYWFPVFNQRSRPNCRPSSSLVTAQRTQLARANDWLALAPVGFNDL